MKYFLYIICWISFYTKSYSQVFQNESYHYQFLANYELLNPAFLNLQDEKAQVSTNYQSFFGPQKVFKTFQLYGISAVKNKKIHLGGRVYANIAEEFSALTFVDGAIQYKIVDEKDLQVSTGMWVGVSNFLLQSNAFYGGSSEWKTDWRFGAFSRYKKGNYGLSLHHFVPTVFQPIQQEIKFAKEINAYAAYQIRLSYLSELSPTILYNIRQELKNKLYWGTTYAYDKKYELNIGFEKLALMQVGAFVKINPIKYGIAYHRYYNQIQTQGYQLQLIYFF